MTKLGKMPIKISHW